MAKQKRTENENERKLYDIKKMRENLEQKQKK